MLEDEWENFPKTFKWKECISFIKDKCQDNKSIYNTIKKISMILTIDGNVSEDEVLLVSILKKALENKIVEIKEIKEKYGDQITNDTIFLLNKDNESYEEYASRIFENKESKYLRKVIVADILGEIECKASSEEKQKLINSAKMLLQYIEKTDRKLMEKLRITVTD